MSIAAAKSSIFGRNTQNLFITQTHHKDQRLKAVSGSGVFCPLE
jgi:hypothetical protein